ncbi:flagellar filament capping protein FliD [Clostridium merdae]|uniref:flagellar filament capping protein FliD n=1 Tax=Clostridium merdae TaxID=1958780 RepID=UPI000A2709FB|nr:flagellar filament capping protein FliD [Clostridium merdae]
MASLSTKSTSSSSLYATASSSKRVTGLMSGLDTDELVKQLTMRTQSKINTANQKKQIALWQQEAYQSVSKSIAEFKSKYFSSSSSSSSILNASFFNSNTIVNNSPYVTINGQASVAQNMQVKSISQLAKQASFIASNKVSTQAIQTGNIQSEWTKSAVTGASIKINFENKDYTLSVGSDGKTTQAAQVIHQLNQQLQDQGLSDKLSAAIVDNKFVLQNKDSASTSKATIKSASDSLLNGFGLKVDDSGTSITGSTEINADYFTNHSIAAGSKLNLTAGGTEYTFTVPSTLSLSVGKEDSLYYKELETTLNDSLKTNADLAKKVKFSVDETGNVSLNSTDGSSVSVTGGSKNLLNGLGLDSGGAYSTTGKVDKSALYKSYLGESLSGANLTFDLNGLSKTISFNESDIANFQDPASLKSYLQGKLDSAFGTNKIQVTEKDGGLAFATKGGSTSDTNVLTITSSSKSGVLGMGGALNVYAGESNRINMNKTLRDVNANFASPLETNTDSEGNTALLSEYKISINGKEFSFKPNDSIDTIMKKINNDSDANVTISYSSTLDRFSVVAKNGGANSKVEIKDVTGAGNLSKALFGASEVNGEAGQDAIMQISFDKGQSFETITRSNNSFTMDGVNFELQKTTPTKTVTGSDGNPVEVPDMDPISFVVESKNDDLVTKIKTFVDDYNAILNAVNTMYTEKKPLPTEGKFLPLTDDQKADMSESQITTWEKKAKQGLMFNDSLLSEFAQEWRSGMTNFVSSVSGALYQIGIEAKDYKENGKLTVDEDKLKSILNSDPEKVSELFTTTDGIANRLQTIIKKYTNDSLVDTGKLISKAGSSTSKVDQSDLAKQMKEYDTQVKALKVRLTSQQQYYYNKFSALETYIARMNSQASFFSQNSSS